MIIAQKWKILSVYLDHNIDYPECVGLWSKTEWRKREVIEFLTVICGQYCRESVRAEQDGFEPCAQAINEEFLSLVGDILVLGMGEEKIIAIKELEREGTQETMEKDVLFTEDIDCDKKDTNDWSAGRALDDDHEAKAIV